MTFRYTIAQSMLAKAMNLEEETEYSSVPPSRAWYEDDEEEDDDDDVENVEETCEEATPQETPDPLGTLVTAREALLDKMWTDMADENTPMPRVKLLSEPSTRLRGRTHLSTGEIFPGPNYQMAAEIDLEPKRKRWQEIVATSSGPGTQLALKRKEWRDKSMKMTEKQHALLNRYRDGRRLPKDSQDPLVILFKKFCRLWDADCVEQKRLLAVKSIPEAPIELAENLAPHSTTAIPEKIEIPLILRPGIPTKPELRRNRPFWETDAPKPKDRQQHRGPEDGVIVKHRRRQEKPNERQIRAHLQETQQHTGEVDKELVLLRQPHQNLMEDLVAQEYRERGGEAKPARRERRRRSPSKQKIDDERRQDQYNEVRIRLEDFSRRKSARRRSPSKGKKPLRVTERSSVDSLDSLWSLWKALGPESSSSKRSLAHEKSGRKGCRNQKQSRRRDRILDNVKALSGCFSCAGPRSP